MSQQTQGVTVVTGGGRGIGAAVVERVADAGSDVVVNYLGDASAAERVASAARSRGVQAVTVQGDVSDPEDVDRLFDEAARLGTVIGLVNNAGLTAHIGPLAQTPVDVIRRVLDVNLLGAVLCSRRAAQVMSQTGRGGAVVNISSVAATLGSAQEYVHYAAAKAGVEALTVGLAKELAGVGIRVNAVSPGLIRTDIHAAAGDPDRLDRVTSRIPMGRPGLPEEVAPAVAWLLGPDAGYVTGATLRVSGGL